MSPIVTDPYQPLERRHRITRRCLEVLLAHGFSPCLLTRAARMVEDAPLLARFERAWVGVSIPTDDDQVRHAFEPGADPLEARLQCLAACRAAGLDTFAVVQPMLPMTPARLVERLAPLIRVVRIDRMHCEQRTRHIYQHMGWAHALDQAWFASVEQELRQGFEHHGVLVHPLDDLGALFALGACP
jgi:DNA repair photolyase